MVEANSPFAFSDCDVKSDNPYWHVMRRADYFMHMINHIRKHYEHGGCGVRSIVDLHLYRRKNSEFFNSVNLRELFGNDEMYDFYQTLVEIVDKWFLADAEITELSPFEIYTITGGVYGTFDNRVSKKLEKKSKFAYVMRALFPSVKTIRHQYKWVRKCIILLPFGYIHRIIKAMFNGKMKRHAKAVFKSKKTKDADR
jgi:hypothetical protein